MRDEIDEIDYSLYYRKWHDSTDEHFARVGGHLDHWLAPAIAEIPSSARVLDFGCGFGLLTSYLVSRFPNTIGVDASRQQIDVARHRQLPVAEVSIADYPAWVERSKDCFDVIFLFDVLEHVAPSEHLRFLKRLVSTLRPGGTLFIKVPNASSMLAARWRYGDWTHQTSFTECSLEFVCAHCNLGDFVWLDDDSSSRPRYPWLPRWGMRNYYVKTLARALWRIYVRSELGADEKNIKLGLNLFLKARRRACTAAPRVQAGGASET